MNAVAGCFDGDTCIPPSRDRKQTVQTILRELTGILQSNTVITAEDIKKERLEEKYGHSSRY